MAILGMDGFDHYGTTTTDYLGEVEGNNISNDNADCYLTATGTRFGTGNCLVLDNSNYLDMTRGCSTITNTIVVSFAYMCPNFNTREFLEIRNNANASTHVTFRINANGTIRALRANSTEIAVSTAYLSQSVWYWIEFKVTISDTVGQISMEVNGSSTGWINTDADLDTANGTTAPLIGAVRLYSVWGGMDNHFDDVVWQDDSGAFIGDSRIETFMPAAENGTPDWTPSTGTDNSALVDEIPPNDDTDYVSSSTVDHLDLYDVDALTDDDTIHAVGLHVRARKTDTGDRSIESRTKSSTNEQGGVDKALSTTYVTYTDVFETYNGSNAWTKTLFDAAQFGVKVTV